MKLLVKKTFHYGCFENLFPMFWSMFSSAGIISPTLEEFIKNQTKQNQKETKLPKKSNKTTNLPNNTKQKKAKKFQLKTKQKAKPNLNTKPDLYIYFSLLTNV